MAYVPTAAPFTRPTGYLTESAALFLQTLQASATAPYLRNPTLTTPAGVQNGDFWIEATGTSPTRTISGMVRDGGVNIAVFQFVY